MDWIFFQFLYLSANRLQIEFFVVQIFLNLVISCSQIPIFFWQIFIDLFEIFDCYFYSLDLLF